MQSAAEAAAGARIPGQLTGYAIARAPRTRTDLRAQLRIRNERLGAVLVELRDRGQIRRLRGLWYHVPVPAP